MIFFVAGTQNVIFYEIFTFQVLNPLWISIVPLSGTCSQIHWMFDLYFGRSLTLVLTTQPDQYHWYSTSVWLQTFEVGPQDPVLFRYHFCIVCRPMFGLAFPTVVEIMGKIKMKNSAIPIPCPGPLHHWDTRVARNFELHPGGTRRKMVWVREVGQSIQGLF